MQLGIPLPCFSTALAFYDGYRHAQLPANLIQVSTRLRCAGRWAGEQVATPDPNTSSSLQAQRDYFGAHTYELLTKPGQFVHTNWTGHGGSVSSSSYNA